MFASTVLLAGPTMAQPATPSGKPLTIGFYPTMESGREEMARIVAESGVAVIGIDSDYALTTDSWIPDYLTLTGSNARQTDFDGVYSSSYALGRLSNGDAERRMRAFLPRAARRHQLLEYAVARPAETIALCSVHPDDGKCIPRANGRIVGWMLPTAVRNTGRTMRYIALLNLAGDMAITPLRLRGEATMVTLAPGEALRIPASPSEADVGAAHLVAIAADRPFDVEHFRQSGMSVAGTPGCANENSARCTTTLPALALDSTWSMRSLLISSGENNDEPQPAMGGGVAVGGSWAAWMAAIYDTLPYTKEDVERDSAKPLAERKFLADKTEEERAHSCGATLIAPDVVITAAHCVASGLFEGDNKRLVFTARRVRIASKRLGRGGETRAIIGIAVHAGYNGKASGQPNDIALLLLKRDDRVHYTPPPLPIGSAPITDRSEMLGLGWGYTKATQGLANINMAQGGAAQRNPNALQQAPLEKLPFADCAKKMGQQLKPGMVCLVTPRSRREAGGAPTFSCRGDSGGPLVRKSEDGDDELVGLTSWSRGCGAGSPSIYTDVTRYADWIATARVRLVPGAAITVAEPARVPRATRRH
jgi:hypothetical protein